ncbi:DNA cytosine methyltransferase [Tamlana sp. 2201CG12-4]|uniref:DNA cytosine methyltransferase n=1 Tax=Tamlana sp. 2201CG12-4 TaxID=3112582 RepID=UPI002DB83DFF|nr:DNA cytosine methyltransferase [Tamlana sp. 2201CG12-4]MEC3906124.1 DNA cytosine methyltransferase [Tamlana sp. 2201CG12-4]
MNSEHGINLLSLFSGIGVGELALKELQIPINKSFSSEINKHAIKIMQHHFPEVIQLGDIRNIDAHALPKIDLVMCGSSCQDLSVMNKNRLGLDGHKSSLFYYAVRILNVIREKNPDCIFIFENVQMPAKDRQIFTELLGVEPININSGLLGPAWRNRLYYTNLKGVAMPEDKGIYLNDVIEGGYLPPKTKGKCVLTRNIPYTLNGLKRHLKRSIGNVIYLNKTFSELDKKSKLFELEHIKDDTTAKRLFRLMTINELCRMQTLSDNYVSSELIPKTACVKVLGNCFTKEVVKHILSHSKFN